MPWIGLVLVFLVCAVICSVISTEAQPGERLRAFVFSLIGVLAMMPLLIVIRLAS
jgi:hypothetical protein